MSQLKDQTLQVLQISLLCLLSLWFLPRAFEPPAMGWPVWSRSCKCRTKFRVRLGQLRYLWPNILCLELNILPQSGQGVGVGQWTSWIWDLNWRNVLWQCMQVPPLFCDELEFELFPREFELLLEAIWFPVLFALWPPKMKIKDKINSFCFV